MKYLIMILVLASNIVSAENTGAVVIKQADGTMYEREDCVLTQWQQSDLIGIEWNLPKQKQKVFIDCPRPSPMTTIQEGSRSKVQINMDVVQCPIVYMAMLEDNEFAILIDCTILISYKGFE